MTYQRTSLGSLDRGYRDEQPKPCCHRMAVTVDGMPVSTWCVLVDGHSGPHEAPVPRIIPHNEFGPEQAKQRRW